MGENSPVFNLDANDVLALGNAGDVDPLADELLVVPVAPPGGDAVLVAVVAIALAAVFVFEWSSKQNPCFVPATTTSPWRLTSSSIDHSPIWAVKRCGSMTMSGLPPLL